MRGFVEGSFDSLNPFTVKGVPAASLGLIFDSLMTSSPDEPSAEYGLIAEWVSFPPDYSSVTFGINPKARFQDGSPITPEDVVFSFDEQKKAHPRAAFYYKNVVKAEKTGDNEVTFTFDVKGNRELPQIVGQLSVLSKKFWQANGPDGQPRDVSKTTMEIPVGSGAYRIKSFDAGRSITLFYDLYVRVASYFDNSELAAAGLPQGRELEILNEVRDELPPEVFTTEWKNPVNSTPEAFREHMREASKLLADAGWRLEQQATADPFLRLLLQDVRTVALGSAKTENVLRNAEGETLAAEFLLNSPDFQKIVLPYMQDLQGLGIKASARMVDSAGQALLGWTTMTSSSTTSAVGIARQRAARIWGSAAGESTAAADHRHQESGDRQADREDRVLDQPRRSRGRDEGA